MPIFSLIALLVCLTQGIFMAEGAFIVPRGRICITDLTFTRNVLKHVEEKMDWSSDINNAPYIFRNDILTEHTSPMVAMAFRFHFNRLYSVFDYYALYEIDKPVTMPTPLCGGGLKLRPRKTYDIPIELQGLYKSEIKEFETRVSITVPEEWYGGYQPVVFKVQQGPKEYIKLTGYIDSQ